MKKLILFTVFAAALHGQAAETNGGGDVGNANLLNEMDSGLSCTMSYSSSGALSSSTNSTSGWIVAKKQMAGSAVSADKNGLWTKKPANYISVKKDGNFWSVAILDDAKKIIGSFSFTEKNGMKATIPTKAFMANEDEDPEQYDKLEVSCHYTVFAG